MSMSLNLGEDQMRAIVAEAIVSKLDDESRKSLITQAVAKMLEAPKDRYGNAQSSDLMIAFQSAVRLLTHDVVKEYIATHPEVSQKITEAIHTAFDKLVNEDSSIRSVVAEAVSTALQRKIENY